MLRVDAITKDWKEAGSFPAQINLYGFWDEHAFLTKSGDLGSVLKIGGTDYESLDHAGRDYAVKRLEAAMCSRLALFGARLSCDRCLPLPWAHPRKSCRCRNCRGNFRTAAHWRPSHTTWVCFRMLI